jgi:hypothetical protein
MFQLIHILCPYWFLKLFHRRFEAAQTHPLLQMHIHILQRLGVQGMSSDESDGKELVRNPSARLETPRFQVLRPWWRATELTTWLHIFDSIHMIERRSGDGGSRGDYPRLRVDNAQSPTYSNSQNFVRHKYKRSFPDRHGSPDDKKNRGTRASGLSSSKIKTVRDGSADTLFKNKCLTRCLEFTDKFIYRSILLLCPLLAPCI